MGNYKYKKHISIKMPQDWPEDSNIKQLTYADCRDIVKVSMESMTLLGLLMLAVASWLDTLFLFLGWFSPGRAFFGWIQMSMDDASTGVICMKEKANNAL